MGVITMVIFIVSTWLKVTVDHERAISGASGLFFFFQEG